MLSKQAMPVQAWLARRAVLTLARRCNSSMKRLAWEDKLRKNVEKFPNSLRTAPRLAQSAQGTQGTADAFLGVAVRDPRIPEGSFGPGLESNLFMRFIINTIKREIELTPLWACFIAWVLLFGGIVYVSFAKWEIWMDRSKALPPTDWERDRAKYADGHWTVLFPNLNMAPGEKLYNRMPILETLQDEMLEAAKARGTR